MPLYSLPPPRAHQHGAVLVVSLVLLLILTMIGVTVARMQTVEERMSRNEQNRDLALQAAEATLRYAEMSVSNGTYNDFSGNTLGLYTLVPADGSIIDQMLAGSVPTNGTTVLTYAGPALSAVPLAQQPQLVVESLPPVAQAGDNLGGQGGYQAPQPPVKINRITARAVGGDGTATAMIQSIYRAF